MKNIACLFLALLLAGCASSPRPKHHGRHGHPAPVVHPAPVAPVGFVLIDAHSAGHPKDYVKFHNDGRFRSLSATVLFHNPATFRWEPYGNVVLKGRGDTDTMKHSSRLGGGLRKLRYFAVRFSDGRAHPLRLNVARDDLHVYVK